MADSKSSSTLKIIRPAGRVEAYHITRNALGLYTSVMIGAQYHSSNSSTSGKRLDKSMLYPALRRIIHQEPALRMCILGSRVPVQTPKHPAFAECDVDEAVLDRICAFRDHIRWDDEDGEGFTRFLEREMEIGFDADDSSLPLWRLIVCADDTLLFFFHHAIGDGKSGVAFHVMLLEALNSPDDGTTPPPEPRELVPSIEEAMDVRPSIVKILRTLLSLFLPTSWTPLHRAWTGLPVPSAPPTPTTTKESDNLLTPLGLHPSPRLSLFAFTPSGSATLLTKCRSHNTTITSALYILAASVLSRIVLDSIKTSLPSSASSRSQQPFTSLSTSLPISLRPLSHAPEIAFCEHISAWHDFPPLQPEFRWEDARTHAEMLRGVMRGGKIGQEIGVLALVGGNYERIYKGRLGQKRGGTFEISNVGRFPSPASSLSPTPGDSEDARDGEAKAHSPASSLSPSPALVPGDASTKDGYRNHKWTIGKTLFTGGDVITGPAFAFTVIGHGTASGGGITVCMSWGRYTLDEEMAGRIVRKMRGALGGLVGRE